MALFEKRDENRAIGGSDNLYPQAERNTRWRETDGVIPKPHYELLASNNAIDCDLYEKELSKLRSEKKFAEDALQRVSKELRVYQIKYPNFHVKEMDIDDIPNFPNWSSCLQKLNPLISAYDARIQDLESIIANQKGELEALMCRAQTVVAENERLREAQIKDFDSLIAQSEVEKGMGYNGVREVVDELNERINLLLSENTLMAEQTSILTAELDKVHSEVDACEVQNAALNKALSDTGETVKKAHDKISQLNADKEHAESELMRHVNVCSELENKIRELSTSLSTAKEEIKNRSTLCAQLEKSYDDLQKNSEEEIEMIASRVRSSAERIISLQSQLAVQSAEAEGATNEVMRLKLTSETMRTDVESMVKVIASLKKQLKCYEEKEESIVKLVRDTKDQIEEAVLARDQARNAENQIRHELHRVNESRKLDGHNKARETEAALHSLRLQLNMHISTREEEIQDLLNEIARLKIDSELLYHEKTSAEALYKSLKKAVDNENDKAKSRFDELSYRIIEAEENLLSQQHAFREVHLELEDTRSELAAKETSAKSKEILLNDIIKSKCQELESVRNALRRALNAAENSNREATKATSDAEFAILELRVQLEEAESKIKSCEVEWHTKYSSSQNSLNEAQKKLEEKELKYTRHIQNMYDETTRKLSELEFRLQDEQTLVHRHSNRNSDLQNKLSAASLEHSKLSMRIEELASKLNQSAVELEEAQCYIEELKKQLSNSMEHQEKLKCDIKRLQLELTRVATRDKDNINKGTIKIRRPQSGEI